MARRAEIREKAHYTDIDYTEKNHHIDRDWWKTSSYQIFGVLGEKKYITPKKTSIVEQSRCIGFSVYWVFSRCIRFSVWCFFLVVLGFRCNGFFFHLVHRNCNTTNNEHFSTISTNMIFSVMGFGIMGYFPKVIFGIIMDFFSYFGVMGFVIMGFSVMVRYRWLTLNCFWHSILPQIDIAFRQFYRTQSIWDNWVDYGYSY